MKKCGKGERIYMGSDHGDSVHISQLNVFDKVQMFLNLARVQKGSIRKVNKLREAGLPI